MSARTLRPRVPVSDAIAVFGLLFQQKTGIRALITNESELLSELGMFVCPRSTGGASPASAPLLGVDTRSAIRKAAREAMYDTRHLLVPGLGSEVHSRTRQRSPPTAPRGARGAYAFVLASFLLMISFAVLLPSAFVSSMNSTLSCRSPANAQFYGTLSHYCRHVAGSIAGGQVPVADLVQLAPLMLAPPSTSAAPLAALAVPSPLRAPEVAVVAEDPRTFVLTCAAVVLAVAPAILMAYWKLRTGRNAAPAGMKVFENVAFDIEVQKHSPTRFQFAASNGQVYNAYTNPAFDSMGLSSGSAPKRKSQKQRAR